MDIFLAPLTPSRDQLDLTAYRWGIRIYQYDLSSGAILFHRCLEIPSLWTKDGSIDCLINNQHSCIAITITSGIQSGKRFELGLDEGFNLVWSMKLRLSDISLRPRQFVSIGHHRWLINDPNRSEMVCIYFRRIDRTDTSLSLLRSSRDLVNSAESSPCSHWSLRKSSSTIINFLQCSASKNEMTEMKESI